MKRILLSFCLVAAAGLMLPACNNGPYDANPDANDDNIPNPLLPGNVSLGTIRADIDGNTIYFYPAVYSGMAEGGLNMRIISAISDYGTADQKIISLQIGSYHGAGTYVSNEHNLITETGILYTVTDATNNNNVKTRHDSYTRIEGLGGITIEVVSDADERMRGTFSGVLYRQILEDNGAYVTDVTDSIVISNGVYFASKQVPVLE